MHAKKCPLKSKNDATKEKDSLQFGLLLVEDFLPEFIKNNSLDIVLANMRDTKENPGKKMNIKLLQGL